MLSCRRRLLDSALLYSRARRVPAAASSCFIGASVSPARACLSKLLRGQMPSDRHTSCQQPHQRAVSPTGYQKALSHLPARLNTFSFRDIPGDLRRCASLKVSRSRVHGHEMQGSGLSHGVLTALFHTHAQYIITSPHDVLLEFGSTLLALCFQKNQITLCRHHLNRICAGYSNDTPRN